MASSDGKEVILDNENVEDGMEPAERTKRLYSDKLLDSFNKLKTSFEKSLSDKIESPVLGSVQSSSLLQSKSKLSSLLDTYKSKGISLTPLSSTQQGDEVEPEIVGAAAPSATAPCIISQSSVSNSDVMVGAANKPIVLPDYLLDQDSMNKVKKQQSNRITLQQLQETANLRTAINNAVKHGIYVHSASEVKYKNQQNGRLYQPPPSPPKHRPTQRPQYNPQPYNPFRPPSQYNTPPPQPPTPSYYPQPQPQPPQYTQLLPESNPNFSHYGDFFNNFWQNLVGEAGPEIGSARSDFSYVDKDAKKSSVSPDEKLVNPLPVDNQSMKSKNKQDDADDDVVDKMMAKAAQQLASEGIVSNTVESYVNSVDTPPIELNQVNIKFQHINI